MVGVTCVLAAIIASFVFGMANGMDKAKIVAVTAENGANGITFTNNGGPDVSHVTDITVNATQDSGVDVTGTLGNSAGSRKILTGTFTSNNAVIATATFDDGTTQVVLSTTL